MNPAWLAGDERRRGKLLPGYLADLVVLDRDPLECPPDELESARSWRRWSAAAGCTTRRPGASDRARGVRPQRRPSRLRARRRGVPPSATRPSGPRLRRPRGALRARSRCGRARDRPGHRTGDAAAARARRREARRDRAGSRARRLSPDGHGRPPEILRTTLEEASLPDATFDLAVAASSFHWVESAAGPRRRARRAPPGRLVGDVVDALRRRLATGSVPRRDRPSADRPALEPRGTAGSHAIPRPLWPRWPRPGSSAASWSSSARAASGTPAVSAPSSRRSRRSRVSSPPDGTRFSTSWSASPATSSAGRSSNRR